ncbi:MAG: hypothetical protein LBI42_10055 [Chitinispirillales bacterium]|jgi:hypothetical protein|nr:hypothetical protein [Chitinispirillales bacterium]
MAGFAYVTDLDTNEILFANKEMLKVFGNSIIDKKCYEVFRTDCEKRCDFCPVNTLIEKQNIIMFWEDDISASKLLI